jgi:hypothetical protein
MQESEVGRVSATNTARTSGPVEILNSLLQGQVAVAVACRTALAAGARFAFENIQDLREFESEHRQTAAELREEIVRLRGRPEESASALSAFTEACVESASLFGARAALEVLLEGEQHELEEMEEALFRVSPHTRRLLAERLLPREMKHVTALGDVLASPLG